MNWVDIISKTICYIESNIFEDIKINDIAKEIYISPLYLQKGFSIMCGYTISEYIRNRRLSLAAIVLLKHLQDFMVLHRFQFVKMGQQ